MDDERDPIDKRIDQILRRSDAALWRAEQAALDGRVALERISWRLQAMREQRAGVAAPRKPTRSK